MNRVRGVGRGDDVAGSHVLEGHLVLVVEGGEGHGRPPNEDRFEHRIGSRSPCATDRHLDVRQRGGALLGRELAGQCPPRGSAGGAGHLAQITVVELDHHPVDLIGEIVPVRLELMAAGDHLVDARHTPRIGGDGETHGGHGSQHRRVRSGEEGAPLRHPCDLTDLIGQDRQRSCRRDRRVLLAQ